MARHVFETYFKDVDDPLVRHHLDSYNDFLKTKIPAYLKGSNPIRLDLGNEGGDINKHRKVDIYIGGKESNQIRYVPPVDENGNAIFPHMCRVSNQTYALELYADIDIVFFVGGQATSDEEVRPKHEKRFENVLIGKIPLMLKSDYCYLSSRSGDELYDVGECKFELGGYFIIDGSEKVLLTQERLGDNIFYAKQRKYKPLKKAVGQTIAEEGTESILKGKKDIYEFISGIRCVSEDGTKGPYAHFLTIPPKGVLPGEEEIKEMDTYVDFEKFSTHRLAHITLPGFLQPVPLISVFRALGVRTDKDLYDIILAGIPEDNKNRYDSLFIELVKSHERFIQQTVNSAPLDFKSDDDIDLKLLARQTRTRSYESVMINIYDKLFAHCRPAVTTGELYRRKAYLLGHMTRMAMDIALGFANSSDRDHFRFKRLDASGDLCFYEFRRIFNDVASIMVRRLDSKISYAPKTFSGANLKNLIVDDISHFWKPHILLDEYVKAFKKGIWDKHEGVSQELARLSYLGTVSHLRRILLQVKSDSGIPIETRRIHGSAWGLICPTDSPDGSDIGIVKSMALFCSISTASSAKDVISKIVEHNEFVSIEKIHPSIWNPVWTKIFVNSELIGCSGSTDVLHGALLKHRRQGTLPATTCLSWDRLKNVYNIFTDAGRPMRPIYREGIVESDVISKKTWSEMKKGLFDYLDAQETDTSKISMEPYSKKLYSEIHPLTIFSPSGSVIPNADFNQAPRNIFSCQQTKQASSWYNTAFTKRFDTLATWLNYAQRPISHTWTYNPILSCLPYGENAIVAISIYSGYNQEDSIILNEGALNRGLFNTTYFHSYEVEERILDPATDVHTEFANIVTNGKYNETVNRKEGYNYDLLDSQGIIKTGSLIDEKTILACLVSPVTNADGITIGYRDVSYAPKRGQRGIIDAIHSYTTRDGLRGVKIRVAEQRVPVLGDKFSARHGQKGTCGMRMQEEDMPYTSNGVRPDMIVNPHAFPSRMTIGQFVETMATKLGVYLGCSIDSTAFTASNRVTEVKKLLEKAGFHSEGHERLYNGMTGEMMETEIFMGPTYYLRLKHMVEDKINYRTTGPKTLLTRQPVGGRANDGGLRIGEMERDALISHGISKFLNESLMDRSDGSTNELNPETGLFDSRPNVNTVTVELPHAMSLLTQELETMHISVKAVNGGTN